MQTPVSYYGGKQKMVKKILAMMTPHKVYIEPFVGGAAVLFAKRPSPVEIINDINGNVSNFYSTMKNNPNQLQLEIERSLSCEYKFKKAKKIYFNPENHDDVIRAWAFWVGANMSFNGDMWSSFSVGINSSDNSHCGRGLRNKRNRFFKTLSRLSDVIILNRDAVSILEQFNRSDAFYYLDPPYVGARQGHYEGYKQEDFDQLITACENLKGKFLLSSYQNEALKRAAIKNKWTQEELDLPLCSDNRRQRRKIEVLTFNYKIQKTLF